MEENLIIGLFDNIDNQIYDCDTVKVNDECEMHKYVLKDGSTFNVPAFSKIEDTLASLQHLHKSFDREWPKDEQELEAFFKQILRTIQSFFILKEFVRYTNFNLRDNRIEGLDQDVIKASEYVKNLLAMAADLSPIWFWQESEKYPMLVYTGANPYNFIGWNHDDDWAIAGPARNMIMERNIMSSIASSNTPVTLDEGQTIESIGEFRDAKILYNKVAPKVKK